MYVCVLYIDTSTPTQTNQQTSTRKHSYEDFEPIYPEIHLDAPFKTTGEAKHVHTIHGVDDSHAFDAHDYFGA